MWQQHSNVDRSESERKKCDVFIVFRWWDGNTLTAIDIMRKIYWIFAPSNAFRYTRAQCSDGKRHRGKRSTDSGTYNFVAFDSLPVYGHLYRQKKDDDDDEIDSFCGLGSAIIKAIFSAFVNASFCRSLSHWCETGNGWKCGKSSTKTVFGATSERGKNKHLTMARRIPLYETKANREWGAFCWNYTLNYAMHSGSETAMWAA